MWHERGGFQQMMYQWSQAHPYNAVGIIGLRGPANAARLQQAARAVLENLGMSHVLLEPGGRGFRFQAGPSNLAVETLSPPACLSDHRVLADRVGTELNHPFGASTQLPLRIFVFPGHHGHYVGLSYQHWIADGFAINHLIHRILTRYLELAPVDQSGPIAPCGPSDRRVFERRLSWGRKAGIVYNAVRNLLQMRYCHSPSHGDRNDLRVETRLLDLPANILQRLRASARRREATVGDLLLAALAEAVALNTQDRLRFGRRKDLALSSVVDLRKDAHPKLAGFQGVYLGYLTVICRSAQMQNFDRLLRHIRDQTRSAKRNGSYLRTLVEMPVLSALWSRLPPAARARYCSNQMPFVGFLSNQRLASTWCSGPLAEYVTEYRSAAGTGPISLLTLSAATLADRLTLSLTSRVTGLSGHQVAAIAEQTCHRLESL
jgi:hypothetical protein